ncbi:S24 family peptidase [Alkalimonas sp. NCh-2]|uniref:XRE family transcriptional regulator n=1 Tax=Alkalimonas sp. NCh-2 TaxID=3144846 RepID=UPI0031F63E40
MNTKTVSKRIVEAREAAGLTQKELTTKIGWGQSRLSNYERGEREPKLDDLKAISKALGIKIYDLLDSETDHQNIDKNKNYTLGSFDPWDSNTPLGDDEVELPFYKEVELSAGNGSIVEKEKKGFKLRFAKSTLRRYNIQPELAACVTVTGTSMEPVLPDQATVGIDTGNTKIKDGDMYALDHEGLLKVKRLYRLPGGGIRIRSFNQDEYPDEDYPAEHAVHIKVLGRVFWYSVLR